jgi:hypothetical protein
MPPTLDPQLPLSIVILCYSAVILLLIILLILLRVSGQLTLLSYKLSKSSRSSRVAEPHSAPEAPEVGPGTPFDEFLNEDPQRRTLAKKEQFKAYRIWRADKGLNWTKP